MLIYGLFIINKAWNIFALVNHFRLFYKHEHTFWALRERYSDSVLVCVAYIKQYEFQGEMAITRYSMLSSKHTSRIYILLLSNIIVLYHGSTSEQQTAT